MGIRTETLVHEPESSEFIDIAELRSPTWLLRPLNPQTLAELQRSIANVGLLQPIVVRRTRASFEVVFGNHRLEACKRLGLHKIFSIIRSFSDEESFLARVSENLLRNSYVDPIEEARGYKSLVLKGWTIDSIARRLGKSDSYVSERLGLLDRLSPKIHSQITEGAITPSHAEVIARIGDPDIQDAIADLVKRKRLSVRFLENMLKDAPAPIKVPLKPSLRSSNIYSVEIPREFMDTLGARLGEDLFVYLYGRKLIVESTRASSRRGKTTTSRIR